MATKNNDYISNPSIQKTPEGVMSYIYLVKPDQYKAPDGTLGAPKFSVTLALDTKNPEHAAYLKAFNDLNDSVGQELLKGIVKDKKAYRIKDICKEECDAEGNPTGVYFLKATTNADDLKGNRKVISVVDSNKATIPSATVSRAFGGTKGRLILGLKKSTDSNRKTVGLVVYLEKVQITELVEGTGSPLGFDAVPVGAVASDDDSVNF